MVLGNGSDRDLHLEKCLEVVYDAMMTSLPDTAKDDCPAVKCVGLMLAALKAETTAEIMAEMGLRIDGRWVCPHQPVISPDAFHS